MSSRNERLTKDSRQKAAIIFKSLQEIANLFSKKSIRELENIIQKTFDKNELFDLEYFEIAEETTLKSALKKSKSKKYRAFIAVYVENIRLIDNIALY
jgi:pantoate--beta-alanine ligase